MTTYIGILMTVNAEKYISLWDPQRTLAMVLVRFAFGTIALSHGGAPVSHSSACCWSTTIGEIGVFILPPKVRLLYFVGRRNLKGI